MMTFGRLGAFFFFFLSIHLAGVAARPSSNQARSGLLSSQDSELRTNAKRLAAGLTPLKPRQFYKPSRVVRAAASILPDVNRRIAVCSANYQRLGYIAASTNNGRYNIDSSSNSAKHLKVRFTPTSTSTSSSIAITLMPAVGSFPVLAFAGDGTKFQGSTSNILTAARKEVNPGSPPTGVGNAIGGIKYGYSESQIWTYDASSQSKPLTAIWVDPLPTKDTLSTEFYAAARAGDTSGILQLKSGSSTPRGYQKVVSVKIDSFNITFVGI